MVAPTLLRNNRTRALILIGLGALLILVLACTAFFALQNHNKAKVLRAGLEYAQRNCFKDSKPQDVCNSLFAEATEPSWGPDWWVVDIYSRKDTSFSGSVRVEIDNGKARVIDYSINQ